MTDDLKKLIDATRTLEQSGTDKEQQRRSFAYGNTKFENDRITREMIDRQAESLGNVEHCGLRDRTAAFR